MIEFTGTATLSDAVDEFTRRRGRDFTEALLDTPAGSAHLWQWMTATATLRASADAHAALGQTARLIVGSYQLTTTVGDDPTVTVRFRAATTERTTP